MEIFDGLPLVFIIIGSVFIFLGVAFYFIGFFTALNRKGWHKTVGVIDSQSTLLKGIANSFPEAHFEVDGKVYIHKSRTKQTPGIPEGTKVEIVYDPNDPNRAGINTFVQSGAIFKLLGIIFFSIGIIFFIFLLVILFL